MSKPTLKMIKYICLGNRIHRRYDKNFFKTINHCAAESTSPDAGAGDNPEHATIDPRFQSGGGLWSGNCGTANESPAAATTDRIVGGRETERHQYPWMVFQPKAALTTAVTSFIQGFGP